MANDDRKLPLSRVLVVLDPTRMMQPALLKAERIAALSQATLHLYCAVYDSEQAEEPAEQDQFVNLMHEWAERLAHTVRNQGYDVTTQVEWNADWRAGVAAAAAHSDLIVKTASRRRGLARQLMRPADWRLLRDCRCPTLLVNTGRPWKHNRILAAVKLKPEDENHVLLNRQVIDAGHVIATALDGELHACTVHRNEEVFYDRQRFADSCKLPRNRVHATDGTPHHGIAEVAGEIGADVIVIGTAARTRPERNSIIGDTAQRLIGAVSTDIVVLPAAQG